MIWRVKRFFRKLKRVWDFIPIIWKGDDYDYQYSIDLFKYQLDRTADYIQDRGFISDADDVASEIRTATRLMEMVYDDEYVSEAWAYEGDKLKQAIEKQDKAERILWKFIGHNIRKWWD